MATIPNTDLTDADLDALVETPVTVTRRGHVWTGTLTAWRFYEKPLASPAWAYVVLRVAPGKVEYLAIEPTFQISPSL